jgi:hypothetical protein
LFLFWRKIYAFGVGAYHLKSSCRRSFILWSCTLWHRVVW